MDKAEFYTSLRQRGSGAFGTSLSDRQVAGTEAILDEGCSLPLDHLAHVLAEAYHETGGGMYPVKETVFASSKDKSPTDSTVTARLDRAFAKGQLTWVRTPYWRGGWFGRGAIQVTHRENYEKLSPVVGVDLVADPAKALEPEISARIAVEGCRRGLFTGKALADYDGPQGYDHSAARAIVNGDARETGPKVARYANAFSLALMYAQYKPEAAAPADSGGGWMAALITAIFALFGKGKA